MYTCRRALRRGDARSARRAHTANTQPAPAQEGDPADVTLLLVQDHDRIAASMNDIVVRRLFSAGLSLQTALGLMGSGHPAAGRIHEAVGELDLAIRNIRTVLFDGVTVTGTGIRPAPPDEAVAKAASG